MSSSDRKVIYMLAYLVKLCESGHLLDTSVIPYMVEIMDVYAEGNKTPINKVLGKATGYFKRVEDRLVGLNSSPVMVQATIAIIAEHYCEVVHTLKKYEAWNELSEFIYSNFSKNYMQFTEDLEIAETIANVLLQSSE